MPFKLHILRILLLLGILMNLFVSHHATHISGTFRTGEFFKLLAKFGFQKTERHSQRDSYGYIFGNITAKETFPVPITFAVLDKHNFVQLYGNRSYINRDLACQRMFSTIDQFAYDAQCYPKNPADYLRHIPCARNQLCTDETIASNVIPGHQFTYVMSSLNQPRFWYISLVACYRNTTSCTWHYYNATKFRTDTKNGQSQQLQQHRANGDFDYELFYDIQLVNGNPNQSSSNPLTYHFSFDQQNILEMNLIFLTVYLILVPMQIYAVGIQKHPVTKLFTLSLILEFVSLVFMLIYYVQYTVGGTGNENIKTTGDILDILSRSTFMLILLLLAKGWAVTRQQITKSGWILLMSIWIPYCAFHVVLYVWNRTEVDIISDIDEYQTWPGWLVLVSRSMIMLWFLYELRNTMKYEHSTRKLDFLLHFGASSLVWFIYLPIVAIVASQVSPLWRYKLLLGITNSADCLGYCVMTGLLWPNRAGQYLLLASTKYSGMDELDEFNEAPHSLRSETSSFHEMPHDDMEHINLDDDDDDVNDDDDDDDDRNQINILDRTVPGQISSTDLLSDDLTTTTTIVQGGNLMLDIDTPHSPFNSNGNVHNNVRPHSGGSGGGGGGSVGSTILHNIDTTNRYTASSNHSKSDKIANSMNGSAIGDVLILPNKSKPQQQKQQHFNTHSRNA